MRQKMLFFNKKGRQAITAPLLRYDLSNRGRLAKVFLLHCHTAAVATDILHCSQFVFAQMGVIGFGSSAEATFGFIAARITQVTGFVGDRSTIFACIGHR